MDVSNKTALVTGANAGLGFEAAAQLADAGWGKVVLACRSEAKAKDAQARLVERTGKDPFDVVAIDTSEIESAQAAADNLAAKGLEIDFLLLNAGASKKDKTFNSKGFEITYASTLVGHHVLTMLALDKGLLADNARIVIAGSEASRGGMPGMNVHDVSAIADREFGGDRQAAIVALMKLETGAQKSFVNMSEYVTAKLIVAWWVAALARRLPAGTTVNAVSPGAAVGTSFARDAPAAMKMIMLPVMKVIGPLLGMNGPIEDGARRYLDAAAYDADKNGHFYATAHRKKLVGPVGLQTWPSYFQDEPSQEAALAAMIEVTGVGVPGAAKAAAS